MWETPVPTVPLTPQRPLTPCIPLPTSQDSGSYLSQMSAPLFTEDRYSSSSEDDLEMCNAKITHIIDNMNHLGHLHITQQEEDQLPLQQQWITQPRVIQIAPSTPIDTLVQDKTQNQFLHTNIFFIPDGSSRYIHEIQDKVFHARYLENGNNAYLLELPRLKEMLHTSRFLMDEMSGQFYAMYGNTYQCMSTKPMLEQTWGKEN